MDELIRSRVHDALSVEPPPAYLRPRVMASLPAVWRTIPRPGRISFQWAAGIVAVVLTAALVIGLVYFGVVKVTPVVHVPPVPHVKILSPEGMAIGPDGAIYVSDYVGERVFRLDANGSVVVVAGGGTSEADGIAATKAILHNPSGLAVDGAGNLFITEAGFNRIRRVDALGIITTVAGIAHGLGSFSGDGGPARLATLSFPLGLAIDKTGALFVGDSINGRVRKIDRAGTITSLDTSALNYGLPLVYPGYLAFDPAGNLYVSDRHPGPQFGGWCRIIRISVTGKVSVFAGNGTCGFSGDNGAATSAELGDPEGIAFDSSGNLYVADAFNHRIRRIDQHGIITTVAGTAGDGLSGDGGQAIQAQLGYPFGLVMAPGDRLYIADASCPCDTTPPTPGRVRVLWLKTGVITTAAGG